MDPDQPALSKADGPIPVTLSLNTDISAEDPGHLCATVQGTGQGGGSTVSMRASLSGWTQGQSDPLLPTAEAWAGPGSFPHFGALFPFPAPAFSSFPESFKRC